MCRAIKSQYALINEAHSGMECVIFRFESRSYVWRIHKTISVFCANRSILQINYSFTTRMSGWNMNFELYVGNKFLDYSYFHLCGRIAADIIHLLRGRKWHISIGWVPIVFINDFNHPNTIWLLFNFFYRNHIVFGIAHLIAPLIHCYFANSNEW